MKIYKYFCLFLVFVMLAGSSSPVFAQDYIFQVPEKTVVVTANVDGSIDIDYTLTFLNDANAHEIDIVDIGLPNYNYALKNITAEVDGQTIKKITNSDLVFPGISLYLQENTIPPGGRGTVNVSIRGVKEVIYPGTQEENEAYASLKFWPHWYDRQYCYGNTKYQMTILLPTGVQDTEGRYYPPVNWPGEQEPESMIMEDGRIFYTWVSDQANSYTQYEFAASFPARLLNEGAIVTEPYVPPSESDRPNSGINLSSICPFIFCLGFAGFFALMIYSGIKGANKRKLQYLPPKMSIEGNGIKRGLTAVEAAVMMEQPMDKIFTMILFGLLKKNAAEVTSKDPLNLKAADPLPADLYGYETDFLSAFKETDPARRKALQVTMVNLIKSVTEKMKGFSRRETIAFYQEIMNRAWTQVEQAATPEVKAQVYEEVMDWTMLDKKYEDKTQDVFSGPVFVPAPSWWWRYEPTAPRPSTIVTAKPSSIPSATPTISPPSIPMPKIPGSTFAASVVNSVSNFSSNVLGGLSGFSSGVTNVTNPPPPPSTYRSSGSRGSGGGGGHSCACACACAGCACACAGGGR